jgi:nucleoside phosphorylase
VADLLPVAVLTALDWEERAVLAALGPDRALRDGVPALVVRCGVGLRAAMVATQALPPVRCVVVVGCAGGLQPTLRTGDLVVAAAVGLVDPDGVVQAHWPAADAGVAAAAKRQGIVAQVGPIVSSPIVLAGPAAKAAVAASGALTVDMESAAIMGVVLQRRIPFVAIRVVLDEAGDALPADLDVVDERGDVRFGAAVRAALRQPRVVLKLAGQRSVCERRLAEVLPVLLRGDALGLPPAERSAANA